MNHENSMKKMETLWALAVEQKDVMAALNVFNTMMALAAAEATKGEKNG
jgi:hypothetical protein